MPASLKSYIVVSSLPIVVEDEGGKSTSYNPGDVFQALDNNVSVVRLLAVQHIVPFVGQSVAGEFVVQEGPQGPTGPPGPAGGGETNTNSNAGGDEGLVLPKSGVDTPIKGLTAGTNITLTPSATDITISAAGASLEQTLLVGNVTNGADILMSGGDQIVGTTTVLDPGAALDTQANEVVAAINELQSQVALIAQVFS